MVSLLRSGSAHQIGSIAEMSNIAVTVNKLRWLASHDAFKENPLKVLGGVVRWEWHRASSRPAKLQLDGIELISRPFDGNGRLICYFGERFDPLFNLIKIYLKPGMVYVDVGANIGSHVLNAGRIVGESGRVYAFEADPGTYSVLKSNVELNHLKNAIVRNECVLDSEGYITFYLNKDSGKNSVLQDRAPGIKSTISVHGNTLDTLLPEGLKIDLLKIDVESADYKVLQGATRLFEDNPPSIVVIEVYDVNSEAVNSREVLAFLGNRNYKIHSFDGDRLRLYKPGDKLLNLYAIHETAMPSVANLL
jgi:FkbM family methyltransferase